VGWLPIDFAKALPGDDDLTEPLLHRALLAFACSEYALLRRNPLSILRPIDPPGARFRRTALASTC
jgi:hypothetical protein